MKTYISIVSDDLLFWNLLIPLLHKSIHDVQIDVCRTFQEIDEKLDAKFCDLVLIDGGLTGMSSIEVIQFIRLKKNILTPIWFFPEIQIKAYIYKAYQMGASLIINKPFDPYWVTNEIVSLLDEQSYKSAV